MVQSLVTVVLPIYNVEKYLDKCVESVIHQTYSNLEILLVDDGSPDSCPRICDAWAERDSRVRVIHKQNQGLGMARNTGIENATGEYICFFDSDDYIREDTVEKTVRRMQQEQADFAVFGFSGVTDSGKPVSTFVPAVGRKTYRAEAVRDSFLPDYIAPDYQKKEPRAFYMSACMAMFSMEMIRTSGWKFVSERDIVSEDVYSLIDLMQYVNTVTVVPEAFYFYRVNEKSLSRSHLTDRYQRIRHFYLETMKLCLHIGYNEDVLHRVSKPYLSFTLAALKQEAALQLPQRQKMTCIKNIIDDEMLQKILQQNKNDVVSWTRRLIFFFMRNKQYLPTYCLLRAKR